jgi:hypothetical protein
LLFVIVFIYLMINTKSNIMIIRCIVVCYCFYIFNDQHKEQHNDH